MRKSNDLFAVLEKVVEENRVTRVSTVTLFGEAIGHSRPGLPDLHLIVTKVGDGLVVDQNIPEDDICGLVWFDTAKSFFDMIGWLTRREAEQRGQRVVSNGDTYFHIDNLELLHDPDSMFGELNCALDRT